MMLGCEEEMVATLVDCRERVAVATNDIGEANILIVNVVATYGAKKAG